MDEKDFEKLRCELESLSDKWRRDVSGPYAAELEYYLSRLTTALSGFTHLGFRSIYLHQQRTELLAQIDALRAQADELRELAGWAREILLRPPPEEKPANPAGFTE
jgi:hypothetical protein